MARRQVGAVVGLLAALVPAYAVAQDCYPTKDGKMICVGSAPPQPVSTTGGVGTCPSGNCAGGSSRLSVEKTPISEILKTPEAKAALEKALPAIPQFYDQIATMTLAQVAPMSQGALDDAKLKELQAEFDKLK